MNNKYLNSTLPNIQTVNGFQMHTDEAVNLSVNAFQVIGQGTFGCIEKAHIKVLRSEGDNSKNTRVIGAIKKVHQDPRYKNRELSIIQRIKTHPNIVEFKYYFYSITNNEHGSVNGQISKKSTSEIYLHIVMECFPESVADLIVRHQHSGQSLQPIHVKIYTYQMLRALGYLRSFSICHRDIKSSNLLVDESSLTLKLCDFGSAKELVSGTTNVSYISSRYYRAPELLFGAQHYTTSIDVWSAGCVLGEMLKLGCLFTGNDTVDQLVKIIRILGSPSSSDVASMNPGCAHLGLPHALPCPIKLFFPHHAPQDLLELLSAMLVYNPSKRANPTRLLSHRAFEELRNLANIPDLYNFLPSELDLLEVSDKKPLIDCTL